MKKKDGKKAVVRVYIEGVPEPETIVGCEDGLIIEIISECVFFKFTEHLNQITVPERNLRYYKIEEAG